MCGCVVRPRFATAQQPVRSFLSHSQPLLAVAMSTLMLPATDVRLTVPAARQHRATAALCRTRAHTRGRMITEQSGTRQPSTGRLSWHSKSLISGEREVLRTSACSSGEEHLLLAKAVSTPRRIATGTRHGDSGLLSMCGGHGAHEAKEGGGEELNEQSQPRSFWAMAELALEDPPKTERRWSGRRHIDGIYPQRAATSHCPLSAPSRSRPTMPRNSSRFEASLSAAICTQHPAAGVMAKQLNARAPCR